MLEKFSIIHYVNINTETVSVETVSMSLTFYQREDDKMQTDNAKEQCRRKASLLILSLQFDFLNVWKSTNACAWKQN